MLFAAAKGIVIGRNIFENMSLDGFAFILILLLLVVLLLLLVTVLMKDSILLLLVIDPQLELIALFINPLLDPKFKEHR